MPQTADPKAPDKAAEPPNTPHGPASQKTRTPKPTDTMADDKFVILHTLVGAHERGKVVAGEQLGDDANIRRMLDVQAIRSASDEEAGNERVSLVATPESNPSHEARFAAQAAQSRLDRERIVDLENQLSAYQAKQGDKVSASVDAIKSKDAEITALRAENERLKAEAAKK